MTVLLDTDVLIECLRGTPQAQTWLNSHIDEAFAVPGIVAMELIVGCRNQAEQKRTQDFLSLFDVVWPDAQDMARAYDLLTLHRLASNIGIPDCILAAMALNRSTPLYTFNMKHYRVISRLDAQAPYQRV
jgi:predicted nucleic acid-binding protein